MQNGGLESGLLKRVLTDPATGLPNTLYLDLIRQWEQTRAEREGGEIHLYALSISGGDDRRRRELAIELSSAFRKSDFVASEGAERFYLLFAVRGSEDTAAIQDRVSQVAAKLNESAAAGTPPIEVELETVKVMAF